MNKLESLDHTRAKGHTLEKEPKLLNHHPQIQRAKQQNNKTLTMDSRTNSKDSIANRPLRTDGHISISFLDTSPRAYQSPYIISDLTCKKARF